MEFEKTLMDLLDPSIVRPGTGLERKREDEIEITKGVPTPHRGRSKYPFRHMELGDSFFAPGGTVIGLHGCARRHRPMRFTCRSVVENGVAGVRVWRIH
jgi:hypothetical protein